MIRIFLQSGKRFSYKGAEYKIVESGTHEDDTPYVVLEPENEELAERMRAEIRKNGLPTLRVRGRSTFLVLDNDEFPYIR